MMTTTVSQKYIKVLKEELVMALGCTEPIAHMRRQLPEHIWALPMYASIQHIKPLQMRMALNSYNFHMYQGKDELNLTRALKMGKI